MDFTHFGMGQYGPQAILPQVQYPDWSTLDVHDPYWNSTSDESWLFDAIQAEHAISGIAESSLHMEESPTYSHCMFCQQVSCCCASFDTFFTVRDIGETDITAELPTAACTPCHDERLMGSAQGSSVVLQHTPDYTQSLQRTDGPTNSVRVARKKTGRTKISVAAKSILEQSFSSNPYPDRDELRTLRLTTQLKENTIRTWFSNSRSRKSASQPATAPRGHISRLSPANLEELDRLSPVDSHACLEDWLKSPLPTEATPENVASDSSERFERRTAMEPPMPPAADRLINAARNSGYFSRPMSVANSDSSASTACSYGSQRSLDSRGTRRGRRQWKRQAPQTRVASPQPLTQTPASNTYYCTWADCARAFNTPYEWARHEEAMHYFPHRWICCYEPANNMKLSECFFCVKPNANLAHIVDTHLQVCKEKTEEERTFWRPDQLAQHFKRIHSLPIPPEVRQVWLSPNPHFNKGHLRCGFCGLSSSTWEERKDHVASHIQEGATKDMWWPPYMELMPREQYEAVSAYQSPADLEIDASLEYTGIAPEEVQRYISEQDSETNKWTCLYQDCGKVFSRRENIRLHVQTHLGKRQFKCNKCGKCFIYQHDLKRHAKIEHTGSKRYECPCGAGFVRQDALRRHRQCDMCVGGFAGHVGF